MAKRGSTKLQEAYNTKVRGARSPMDLTDPQRTIANALGKSVEHVSQGTMTRSEYWRIVRGEDPPPEKGEET